MSTLKINTLDSQAGGAVAVNQNLQFVSAKGPDSAGSYLPLLIGGVEKARLSATGLGILKTPTVPLDVLGAAVISGALSVGGKAGMGGEASPATEVDIAGRLRSTASGTTPASGTGLEFGWNGTIGFILAYDRTGASNKPISLANGDVYLNGAGRVGINGITTPDCALDVAGAIAITDGITAPGTLTGKAVIYVDTADGDLKVKFSNGFVAVLAADS